MSRSGGARLRGLLVLGLHRHHAKPAGLGQWITAVHHTRIRVAGVAATDHGGLERVVHGLELVQRRLLVQTVDEPLELERRLTPGRVHDGRLAVVALLDVGVVHQVLGALRHGRTITCVEPHAELDRRRNVGPVVRHVLDVRQAGEHPVVGTHEGLVTQHRAARHEVLAPTTGVALERPHQVAIAVHRDPHLARRDDELGLEVVADRQDDPEDRNAVPGDVRADPALPGAKHCCDRRHDERGEVAAPVPSLFLAQDALHLILPLCVVCSESSSPICIV